MTITIHRELTEYEEKVLENFYFWLDGVIGCILAMVGLIINSLSIYIFTSKKDLMNRSTYLLVGLLIAQNLFLLTKFTNNLYFDFNIHCLAVLIPYIVYPIEKVSLTSSVFLTVCLAHQGYSIICDCEKSSQISLNQKFCRKRSFYYILSVIICSVLFNIPRFFCYEVVKEEDGFYKVSTLPLRQNFHYVVFYDNFISNILTVFVPITMLIFFNWSIYLFVVETRQEIEDWDMDVEIKKQSKNHAKTLIIIIVIFIICHLPRCFLKFYDDFYDPLGIKIVGCLERILLIIHSSSNTVIYLIKNIPFRNYFFNSVKSICYLCQNWFFGRKMNPKCGKVNQHLFYDRKYYWAISSALSFQNA
jgi:hypothetical protein